MTKPELPATLDDGHGFVGDGPAYTCLLCGRNGMEHKDVLFSVVAKRDLNAEIIRNLGETDQKSVEYRRCYFMEVPQPLRQCFLGHGHPGDHRFAYDLLGGDPRVEVASHLINQQREEIDGLRKALREIAAQDSGDPASTSRADCMARIARLAVR